LAAPIPRRAEGLDTRIHGLRGVCALMVFGYHAYNGLLDKGVFAAPAPLPVDTFFYALQCGVDFFFMISGYLIMGSLARHRAFSTFMADRLIRIVPAYYTPVLIAFAAAAAIGYHNFLIDQDPQNWASSLASNLLFYAEFVYRKHALPVAWSLDYEMVFYLLAGTCFMVGLWLGRRAAIVLAIVVSLPLLITLPRFASFACGILAFFTFDGASRSRLTGPRLCLAYFALTLATTAALLPNIGPTMLVAILPGYLFFVSLLRNEGMTAGALRWSPIQYVGTISYSFYLWHIVVMAAVKPMINLPVIRDQGATVRSVVFVLIALAGSLAVSTLSYEVLEARAGRFLRTRLVRRPVRIPAPATAAS
jgi:peptidoglycan/LPS O-acetylase OafA/YrhL